MTTVLLMLLAGIVGVAARKLIRWWRYRRFNPTKTFIERAAFQCPECGAHCKLDRYPPADLKKDHQMWLCSGYCGLGFEVPQWVGVKENSFTVVTRKPDLRPSIKVTI
jgi:hypothetical protein